MSEPAYVSRVTIKRLGSPQRLAYLPAEDQPITLGDASAAFRTYR